MFRAAVEGGIGMGEAGQGLGAAGARRGGFGNGQAELPHGRRDLCCVPAARNQIAFFYHYSPPFFFFFLLCSLYVTHPWAVLLRSGSDRSSPLRVQCTWGMTWERDVTLPHLWCNHLKKKQHHAETLP